MRIIWILFGLLIAIPLGTLTWISSQVDADFLLETANGILEEEGISLTHTGEATFIDPVRPPFLVSSHPHHSREPFTKRVFARAAFPRKFFLSKTRLGRAADFATWF